MIKLTVSRNDNIYECFPDIAKTPDGTLVCVYRECMWHAPFPFSRLVVRRSFDNGMNWTERRILLECVGDPKAIDEMRDWLPVDAIAGYEETRARLTEKWQVFAGINCSRIIALQDGSVFLISDVYNWDEKAEAIVWNYRTWRSTDNGATWAGGEIAPTPGGIVPSLLQLKNGDILLGCVNNEKENLSLVRRSSDNGATWSEAVVIPHTDDSLPDEVSFVELDDGTIVGFGRNNMAERAHRPSAAAKVISYDGGKTWAGPFDTWLVGCEGRPKAGLLHSGEVCITYRCGMPNEALAMHVMSQDAAKSEDKAAIVERMPTPEDIPAKKASEKGEERPWYMTSYYPGRTVILDMDRSVHRDAGYSGWVQLYNGDIYVVDYINDDAPLAHIRGYIVSRSDIILFPEGDLPWLHPSSQPFRAITQAMTRQQITKNCQKLR